MRPRSEEWGDDRAERDAEAAIRESAADDKHGPGEEARTLWYFIRRSGKRIAVALIGGGMVIGGILLIPLPGPGWAIVFAGLAVLATEFVWAERLLGFAKKHAENAMDAVIGEKGARSGWAISAGIAACVGPAIVIVDRVTIFSLSFADQRWWMDRVALVAAVITVFCGHMALSTIKRNPHRSKGRWMAIASLVLGYGFILAVVIVELQ